MKQYAICIVSLLLSITVWDAASLSQSSQTGPVPIGIFSEISGSPPQIAFDIPKADIDSVLKNSTPTGVFDRPLRVVDMGKYNLEVAIIRRNPTNDKPGDPISGTYHSKVGEIYIMLSGSGTFTSGGTTTDAKPSIAYNLTGGPSVNGTSGKGAYSRKLQAGDIVVIPPGTFHAWSQVTEPLSYLCVRVDPDRALPAGFVSPLLLNNGGDGPEH
jgi:mannose-6-phosphate isomerase-like protein (cupin superfamily)